MIQEMRECRIIIETTDLDICLDAITAHNISSVCS